MNSARDPGEISDVTFEWKSHQCQPSEFCEWCLVAEVPELVTSNLRIYHVWWKISNPVGIFDADKGLESGLSIPNFQYFRSRSSPVCHYCSVIHLSLFWFLWYQTSPILGWTKTSTENNIQKIFDPKWTQKYDNVGGFKWSWSGPCPLGTAHFDNSENRVIIISVLRIHFFSNGFQNPNIVRISAYPPTNPRNLNKQNTKSVGFSVAFYVLSYCC